MSRFINRFATPLTTGLFIISATSGTALFFRWAPGTFHKMHVWLSMVLLLPFFLHVWKNWRSLWSYARRGTLILPLVLCLAVALPFALSGLKDHRHGNPAFQLIPLLTQARLSDLAPVLKTTPDNLMASLKKRGLTVRTANETLEAVALDSDRQADEVLFALMPRRTESQR